MIGSPQDSQRLYSPPPPPAPRPELIELVRAGSIGSTGHAGIASTLLLEVCDAVCCRLNRRYNINARNCCATTNPSDLAFILDCTGSMQRYINSVRDHIFAMCDMIRGEEGLGGPDDLRVAVSRVVAYIFSFSSLRSLLR